MSTATDGSESFLGEIHHNLFCPSASRGSDDENRLGSHKAQPLTQHTPGAALSPQGFPQGWAACQSWGELWALAFGKRSSWKVSAGGRRPPFPSRSGGVSPQSTDTSRQPRGAAWWVPSWEWGTAPALGADGGSCPASSGIPGGSSPLFDCASREKMRHPIPKAREGGTSASLRSQSLAHLSLSIFPGF